jgi:hypothetical protein
MIAIGEDNDDDDGSGTTGDEVDDYGEGTMGDDDDDAKKTVYQTHMGWVSMSMHDIDR